MLLLRHKFYIVANSWERCCVLGQNRQKEKRLQTTPWKKKDLESSMRDKDDKDANLYDSIQRFNDKINSLSSPQTWESYNNNVVDDKNKEVVRRVRQCRIKSENIGCGKDWWPISTQDTAVQVLCQIEN